MTNIDVIAMALKAGFKEHNGMIYVTTINDDCAKELKAFAALVRADAIAEEREVCAKVCDDLDDDLPDGLAGWQYGEAIRARGATHDL